MTGNRPGLALGTVQFGLAYGVAGASRPTAPAEARAILGRAWELGIRTLDTAPVYGDIEERLASLIGDLEFRIVSKIAPLPSGLGERDSIQHVTAAFDRSRERLGRRLSALLFHRAEDLLCPHAAPMWDALSERCARHGVALGVSGYDCETMERLRQDFPLSIAQLPGNAFDQSLARREPGAHMAVHLRSAFLQGLLLMPQVEAARRVPAAARALERWHDWRRRHQMTPLQAALSIVRGWNIEECVVGVQDQAQLEEIAQAWDETPSRQAPELASIDPDIIDPRRWPPKETS
ncbi:MAG TPA: aldo/keto reductase [Burkholderiaceae bacterium]